MIYFTADTHFGHDNVIRFCNRPFSCAAEMDEALIANWNGRVKGNDTVYILGDMFFRSTNFEEILKRLKGRKRLIVGNHDGSWMTKADISRYFASIDKFLETTDGQHALTLCHYPMLTWTTGLCWQPGKTCSTPERTSTVLCRSPLTSWWRITETSSGCQPERSKLRTSVFCLPL